MVSGSHKNCWVQDLDASLELLLSWFLRVSRMSLRRSAMIFKPWSAMVSHGQLDLPQRFDQLWWARRQLWGEWKEISHGFLTQNIPKPLITCQYEKMFFIISENAWKMLVYHHVPPVCNFSWAISYIYPSKHRSCPPHFGRCTQLRQLGLHVPHRAPTVKFLNPKKSMVCKCLMSTLD